MGTHPTWLAKLDLDPATADSLRRFAGRRRTLLICRGLAVGVVAFFAAMAIIALCDHLWLLSEPVRWALSACGYAISLLAMWRFGVGAASSRDPRLLARQLESTEPRLREQLLSAVELADPEFENGSPAFRSRLQRRVGQRMATLDPKRLLPLGLIRRWLSAGAVVALVLLGLLLVPSMQFGRRLARAALPGAAIQRASLTQLTILQPQPASGFVAQGDSVGIVVAVGGEPTDEVKVRFRSADGALHQRPMTSRRSGTSAAADGGDDTYAANLPVGSAPIDYQVLAGDAATLWQTLTPLPRPHVESFQKRYRYPNYTRLEERVVVAEHGDLEAFVGTTAEVTVRFDQPVRDAVLRYSSQSAGKPLTPVEGSQQSFVASIPIRMPAQYQIDATSIESGLDNPFSPQYSITPVPDSPPTVRWSDELDDTMLVSPFEVVSLSASVQDDLPVDRVIQEYQINSGPWLQRHVPGDHSQRELSLHWSWDLMHPDGSPQQTRELSVGDTVRSRVVAVDRRAKRGSSRVVEFLLADPQFDRNRHQYLGGRREWTLQAIEWLQDAQSPVEQIRDVLAVLEEDPLADAEVVVEQIESLARTIEQLESRAGELRQRGGEILEAAETAMASNNLEWMVLAVEDLDRRLRRTSGQLRSWGKRLGQVPAEDRGSQLDRWRRDVKEVSSETQQVASSLRALHAHALTAGFLSDLVAVGESVQPLTDQRSDVPVGRFARYAHLTAGQLQSIDELLKDHEAAIPESTRRQHVSWFQFSDRWKTRLREAISDRPGEEAWRAMFRQFQAELDQHSRREVHDGRAAAQLRQVAREVPQQIGWISQHVDRLREIGLEKTQLRRRADESQDSRAAAAFGTRADLGDAFFGLELQLLGQRIEQRESLHRRRRSVDLRYAADLNLLRRALEQVTAEGFQPYREEAPEEVLTKLADAFHLLEASHLAGQWLGELRGLIQAERYLETRVGAELENPLWIQRIGEGLPWAVESLQSTGVDSDATDAIERIPSSERFERAREQITSRRYQSEPPVPADSLLAPAQRRFADAMRQLEVPAEEARDVLRRYLATLPEQARQAAEEVERARQRTDARDDSSAPTAERLAEQQKPAERAVQETLRSLVDKANTADLSDPDQRELARDADAAAAKIRAEVDQLEQASERSTSAEDDRSRGEALEQTEDALQQLADTLRDTARHFEAAAEDRDVAESRELLRQGAPDSPTADSPQRPRDAAERLAEAAQRSPEELMEELERELETNQPMQEELDRLAQRSADVAQRTVGQAAREQRSLGESLERSDPVFREKKQLLRQRLAALAERAAEVEETLMQAAEQAVGWANDPQSRLQIERARQTLREAAQRSRSLHPDNSLLSEMQAAAADMAQTVQAARETAQVVQQRSARLAEQNIHRNQERRDQSERQMQQIHRDARNERVRVVAQQRDRWSGVQQDAGRRLQQAQRRERQAQEAQRRAEDRLKQEPDDASAQQQFAAAEHQLQTARKASEAARETRQFAGARAAAAADRQEQLKKRPLTELDRPNPASQLAERLTAESTGALEQIAGELQQLQRDAQVDEQLRVPRDQAERLADQQRQINQSVQRAAEHLRRAGRHQQRLGQSDAAQRLGEAAEAVQQAVEQQARQALESLQAAAEASENSPQAAQQVGRAAERFREQARKLAETSKPAGGDDDAASPSRSPAPEPTDQQTAEAGDPSRPESSRPSQDSAADSPSQPPSPGQSAGEEAGEMQQRPRGRELARTLDELDRVLHRSAGAESASAESAPDNSTSDKSASGEPEAGAEPAPPSTAGEASQTLASSLQQQVQRAARQRERQSRGENAGRSAGGQGDQPSGSAGMAAGGRIDPEDIVRGGDSWGQLRQQRTEDAVESRSLGIPPQYRQEIEAYFQAVAERAAQRSEGARP